MKSVTQTVISSSQRLTRFYIVGSKFIAEINTILHSRECESMTGSLCESTDRMTKRIAEQMSREEAQRALQNFIEIDKDIHAQMKILSERIWPEQYRPTAHRPRGGYIHLQGPAGGKG
jgi:hypothetical protein